MTDKDEQIFLKVASLKEFTKDLDGLKSLIQLMNDHGFTLWENINWETTDQDGFYVTFTGYNVSALQLLSVMEDLDSEFEVLGMTIIKNNMITFR